MKYQYIIYYKILFEYTLLLASSDAMRNRLLPLIMWFVSFVLLSMRVLWLLWDDIVIQTGRAHILGILSWIYIVPRLDDISDIHPRFSTTLLRILTSWLGIWVMFGIRYLRWWYASFVCALYALFLYILWWFDSRYFALIALYCMIHIPGYMILWDYVLAEQWSLYTFYALICSALTSLFAQHLD